MRTVRTTVVSAVTLLALATAIPRAAATSQKGEALLAPSFTSVKAPSVYMIADKMTYRTGERISLTLTTSPNDNPNPYFSFFFYLEDLQTGEKRYHPNYQADAVTDMFNIGPDARTGRYPIYLVPALTDFPWLGNNGYMGPAALVPTTPGTYRYVLELRDATGTYVQAQAYAPFTVVEGVETLSGDITSDRTLTNRKAYILSGMVFVRSGATLTIEPGTIIYGETATLGGLCITQGAKIRAIGTPSRPIVFTSASPVGARRAGDWFGVAIAGRAPINVTGGSASVEGIETVSYGGTNPDDDSGIMRYVRIEYAGIKFTPTREANGLYLNGVGSRTVLEYLHFNNNADDNIEFFGGTANVKYVLCTGGEDDQLDWTEGWQGKAQFVIAQVYPDTGANRGIEADNWENNFDASPRSNPTIYNMTIVGPRRNYSEGEGKADHGLMLRRGTAGKFYNFIVTGYGRDAINLRDDATIAQATAGNLVFDHAILHDNGVFGADGVGTYGNTDTRNWITSKSKKVVETDPLLVDAFHRLTPDFRPGYLSPVHRIDMVKQPPDDGFFSRVDFIGGISPDHNWLAGGLAYITVK